MPTQYIKRSATPIVTGKANAAPIYVDSDDNILKYIPAGTGTTEIQIVDASTAQTLTNKTLTAPTITGGAVTPASTEYLIDGAIAITSHTAFLTKATVGAYTLAAPSGSGSIIDLVNTTSNAHVITGTNLFWAGVTGGPFNKVTVPAFPGHNARLIGFNGLWHVLSSGLGLVTVGD